VTGAAGRATARSVSTTLGVAAKLWPGSSLSRLRWHARGVLWFRPRAFLRCSACSGWPGGTGSLVATPYAGQYRWVGHALVRGLDRAWAGLRGRGTPAPSRCAATVHVSLVGLLVLSRIFSFQYLLWAVAFFAMVWARRDRLLPAIYAGCCLVTLAVFSQWWFVLTDERTGAVRLWVVLAITLRNLVLVGVAAALITQAFRHPERATHDIAVRPETGEPEHLAQRRR
jgi:hypothetical protein